MKKPEVATSWGRAPIPLETQGSPETTLSIEDVPSLQFCIHSATICIPGSATNYASAGIKQIEVCCRPLLAENSWQPLTIVPGLGWASVNVPSGKNSWWTGVLVYDIERHLLEFVCHQMETNGSDFAL